MTRTINHIAFALGLLALTPFAANASGRPPNPGGSHTGRYNGHVVYKGHVVPHGSSHAKSVPEIDPNAAGAGFVLLAGSAMVLNGRRRRAI